MRRTKALVAAHTTTAGGQAALRLKTAAGAISAPGQVCLACRSGGADPLRHTLLPLAIHPDGFTCAQPDGDRWFPGDELDLLGPLGRGFHPPAHGGRWLLAAVGLPFHPQLPLLHMGLGRHADVAVLAEAPMLLPPEVEVVNQLDLAADWADYQRCGAARRQRRLARGAGAARQPQRRGALAGRAVGGKGRVGLTRRARHIALREFHPRMLLCWRPQGAPEIRRNFGT